MSTSSGSPFTPQKSIVTFHYIFDWKSLTKVKSKINSSSYGVIRSNFESNYYDLPTEPQDIRLKEFGESILDTVKDEEKNNIIMTNALVVEFGNRTEMPRDESGLLFGPINANVTDEKTGESEEKKTEKHFDNEFLFLESIINDRNIKNVYFLMIDENEFSFRSEKALQKKYYKKSPNSYLHNSINRLINSKSDYRKGRSYVHPPILKTKFGRDNKERLLKRYESVVTSIPEKKIQQDIFWFLCYLIQELHKQYNLHEKPLKPIVNFDVDTITFGIAYNIKYMPSSRIEYFNKDENFVANSDKNFVYVVKGKKYKVISVLLNDPLTLFCNEIEREDSKVNMVLTKQFGGDTNIIYHATITEKNKVKPISGILHKERKNKSVDEAKKEGTLSTKNISTLSLNSERFYYAPDLVFSENHLIQFMKSTNASDILSQISKDSVQDFIVYVLSRKSAFVQFYKYCKFKLKLNRTADEIDEKTIITQTTQLLLRPGIPFSLTPSDTEKERTLDDVMYSVEKIISDKKKVDIGTGKIDIDIQLAYKDKKKPIGVGSNCKDSKENLMNVLRDSIKDTMMSLVRGVKGGTKKYKKRKRKTIKKKRRLS